MVLKSATEDDESKIRAMKSAAESGSIKSPFTIVAYDVNEFCAHDFIHINFVCYVLVYYCCVVSFVSVTVDVKDGNISALRGAGSVYLARKLRKFVCRDETLKLDLARERQIV